MKFPQRLGLPVAAVALVLAGLLCCPAAMAEPGARPPASRTFLFTYAATITQVSPGTLVRIWLPVPSNSPDQDVQIIAQDLPAEPQFNTEPKEQNRLLYFQSPAKADGTVHFSIVYRITRREVAEQGDASRSAADAAYLRPDELVPIGGKPAQVLLTDRSLPNDQFQVGRLLYDLVDDHLQYRKDKPGWGRGDAVWACDSGFGNCTDFHSLFISLARTANIPAKFEIGFMIPSTRGAGEVPGYHCWAKFKPQGHGWVPVDISEANKNPQQRAYFFGHLCENRVAFSSGRDLELVPPQSGAAVNFLVDPYVEIDGKQWPADRIVRSYRYEDTGPSEHPQPASQSREEPQAR